jgi:hypothetical protein
VVLTEENVIASLDLRSGDICQFFFSHSFFRMPATHVLYMMCINVSVFSLISVVFGAVWRHVIEKNDPIDQLSLSLGKCESTCFRTLEIHVVRRKPC